MSQRPGGSERVRDGAPNGESLGSGPAVGTTSLHRAAEQIRFPVEQTFTAGYVGDQGIVSFNMNDRGEAIGPDGQRLQATLSSQPIGRQEREVKAECPFHGVDPLTAVVWASLPEPSTK